MPGLTPGPRTRREVAAGFGVVAASAALVAALHPPGGESHLGLWFHDAAFAARGRQSPDPRVLIAAIDEKTTSEMSIRLRDWTRAHTAELVERLAESGAAVIGLDLVLAARATEEEDARLAEALDRSTAVLACHLDETTGELEDPIALFHDPAADRGAVDIGHINWRLDADGKVRRLTYLVGSGAERRYALSLRLVGVHETLRAQDLPGQPPVPDPYIDETRPDGLGWGRHVLPYPELVLDFAGPAGTYQTVSAVDILKGRTPREAVAGRIVLVGVTHKLGKDLFATPVDRKLPGVELHATAIGNVLSDRLIARLSRRTELVLLGAAGLALSAAFGLLGLPVWALSAGACAAAAASLGAWAVAFVKWRTLLDPCPFLVMVLVTSSTGGAYHWVLARKKASEVRLLFSRHVSRNVVDAMLRGEAPVALEGRRKQLTVLFSDIRGFTSISETLPPAEVAAFLNRYFGEMIGLVFEAAGTLNKLMGDAIMAFFGDPAPMEDHARRACQCALAMSAKLDEIRLRGSGTVLGGIDIGIGVNTGEVLVGNLGSKDFVDYTVIGDEVNLASRLEGLTRLYEVRTIASDSARSAAGPGFVWRTLDTVAVKGKTKPVGIHELVGESGAVSPERSRLVERFEQMLARYRERKFHEAARGFESLLVDYPRDGPSKLYLARCREFIETPPPPDWHGVTVMHSK